jgi:hypothetical protein
MKTFTVELINPKAKKLLQDLADMDIITLKENRHEEGWNLLSQEQQESIFEALESIKQGKGIPHHEIMSMVKIKFNNA